jgi:hypothetical protein
VTILLRSNQVRGSLSEIGPVVGLQAARSIKGATRAAATVAGENVGAGASPLRRLPESGLPFAGAVSAVLAGTPWCSRGSGRASAPAAGRWAPSAAPDDRAHAARLKITARRRGTVSRRSSVVCVANQPQRPHRPRAKYDF